MPGGGAVTAGIIGGSSLLGGGLSLAGGKSQASAARSAAQTQLQGAKLSADTLQNEGALTRAFLEKQAGIARADLQPYQQMGLAALKEQYNIAMDPNSAGAQRERNVASDAIAARLSSQGLLRSGAFGQNLSGLEQNLIAERYSRLSALSGMGSNASNSAANIATGLGAQIANNNSQIASSISQLYTGTAQSVGQLGMAANQYTNQGLVGFGNAVQGGLGNYLNYNMLNKFYGNGGAPGGGAPMSQSDTALFSRLQGLSDQYSAYKANNTSAY